MVLIQDFVIHNKVVTKHLHIDRFVPPEKFDAFGDLARELGFIGVASGPNDMQRAAESSASSRRFR